ncbi:MULTISPECIES: LbetaH domain-containing protein [unclassified Rhizobium]|uniref:DapH/DapD/GlmU-related protein n=1 Tax=unclassified Rhizobium TaxID=2613769 RepID=UPI001ADAF481|nr:MULTISPECIES: DapH/DapD/GlmU-related protein [unclassified Rhizobium]MBO9125306.1 putative colanic acid biosynthesis acetyltransferase [Rhizobium sp. 16-488-2b]MBO9175891.1 putative colanic acid biosynthesis acetyltransferase [Rhizobium sp. 16-488-2a]
MSDSVEENFGILDAARSGSREGGPSFSVGHRALRLVWGIVWALLAAWTPAPLHRWRAVLLRLFGARLARNARVHGSARIWYPPHLVMEENTLIGRGAIIYCIAPVHIRRGAVISQGAHLCTGSHDIDDASFQLIARPITIGAAAWVAAEAFVGPGVSIGEGAVLGARGVAFSDLAAWTVYAGNPARPIRARATSP